MFTAFSGGLFVQLDGSARRSEQKRQIRYMIRRNNPERPERRFFILTARKARKGKDLLNTNTNAYQNTLPPGFSPVKVRERKIGRSTFIVSSRFNDNKQKDIVSTVARLVQYDNGKVGTSGQVDLKWNG